MRDIKIERVNGKNKIHVSGLVQFELSLLEWKILSGKIVKF